MFTKLHKPINQGIRPARSEKTINMASVSSHIDLKNRVSDFWHMRLLFFLQEDKVWKGKKIELPTKKGITF